MIATPYEWTVTRTCEAFPAQWQGTNRAGDRHLFIHYRWGTLTIGEGATLDAAIEDGRCSVVPTAPLASPGEMSDAVMITHAAGAGYDVGLEA